MLDINLFRTDKGGNPDIIRESQRSRFAPVELVDEVIALDKAWRESKSILTALTPSKLIWISGRSLTPRGLPLLQGSSSWTRYARSSTPPARRSASSRLYVYVSICDARFGPLLFGGLGFHVMVVCFVAEQARRGSKEADGEHGRD